MSVGPIDMPQARPCARPRHPFSEHGALLFVRRESFLSDLRDCVVAIAASGRLVSSNRALYFRHESTGRRREYAGRSVSLSLLLHGAAIALLLYLPSIIPADVPPLRGSSQVEERIYYRIPLQELVKTRQSASVTHRSGAVFRRAAPPKLEDPPRKSLASLVSKPSHPDNLHQTIYQSAAPPKLTINTNQKLPNVIILEQNRQAMAAPFEPSYARPAPIERKAFADAAPTVAASNSPDSSGVLLQLTDSNPHLTIPGAGGGTPIARIASAAQGAASGAPELVVVSDDPADATNQLSLPNGNRWGEFSIAPPVQPGGSRDGAAGSASEKSGEAGNAAADGRRGISGTSGPAGPVDVAGTNDGASGMLASALPVALVYPVLQPMNAIRRNSMVISAGPTGGGGLNIYGALSCGKIYSIFLPMPEKNWSLQYCDRSSARNDAPSDRVQVLRLETPLIPPDVDLDHRYNFKRIAVSAQIANRPIILKGVIEADGTVQKLVVYRGVSAQLDEAARLAFSRWHFKPAMRDGKPVAVDILVGIPPVSGEDHVNR